MSKTKILDINGKETGTLDLPKSIFDNKINDHLIHQAVTTQLSNSRYSIAHTKTRSEVKGSTKKPWRQKGTGRARSGSVKNPLWIGGGIIFGPRSKNNYHKKLNRKMKRKALLQALSIKAKNVIIIDKIDFKNAKTKSAFNFLAKIGSVETNHLIILDKPKLNTELSFRNIPNVKTTLAQNINIYDILKYNNIVITKDAIKIIEEIFGNVNKQVIDQNSDSKLPTQIKIDSKPDIKQEDQIIKKSKISPAKSDKKIINKDNKNLTNEKL